ncbi:MAG: type II CAAX endopeptidase family protein [Candidatus Electryoneaceae bacterium]|nr:type II CAAX endopeptidase family protein [Candidatus Electryoneaceae bacterium]
MNNSAPTQDHTPQPDVMDVLVIGWMVIGISLLSGSLWEEWAGKAEYLLNHLLLLIFVIGYLIIRRFRVVRVMRWRPVPQSYWQPGLGMTLGAVVILDEIDRLVGVIMPLPPEFLEQIKSAYTPGTVMDVFWLVAGIGILAPIVEESLFRGFIQQVLERKWDTTKGVLITSFIFTTIHLNPYWAIQLLIMSVLMGYLAWRWNSVIPAIMIHAGNNLWSLGLLILADTTICEIYVWHGHVNPLVLALAGFIFWKGFEAINKIQL